MPKRWRLFQFSDSWDLHVNITSSLVSVLLGGFLNQFTNRTRLAIVTSENDITL